MRIDDKIAEIEAFLSELQEIIPENFKEYMADLKTKAACERYFEKITEALVDLAYLIIKEKLLKTPEEEKEVFDILAEAGLIPRELSIRLKEAKGMRNILSHQYGNIDDEIVFESITHELANDTQEFIQKVRRMVK